MIFHPTIKMEATRKAARERVMYRLLRSLFSLSHRRSKLRAQQI